MDKLLLMKCLRCRGAMAQDKFYGPPFPWAPTAVA
jgi:hypothetical protein